MQTLEVHYGRTLCTTMHLEKEMYWNDKYTTGEDVSCLCHKYHHHHHSVEQANCSQTDHRVDKQLLVYPSRFEQFVFTVSVKSSLDTVHSRRCHYFCLQTVPYIHNVISEEILTQLYLATFLQLQTVITNPHASLLI